MNEKITRPQLPSLVSSTFSGITRKVTFRTCDNKATRVALIDRPEKYIICTSTQIGCTGACSFCSAWQSKMHRNLSSYEILHMVRTVLALADWHEKSSKPYLVSFMGTGEPMANLDNVLKSINLLSSFTDRFAISTSGYNLHRLKEIPLNVKMQFSVISPFEEINRKYIPHSEPLENIWNALDQYKGPKETNTTLIKGVNNDYDSMNGLGTLLRLIRVPGKLNYFHAMNGLEPAGNEEECFEWFARTGVKAELYKTNGEDINAACGQFELS